MINTLTNRLLANGTGRLLSDIPQSFFELDRIDGFEERLRTLLTNFALAARSRRISDWIVEDAEYVAANLSRWITDDDFASAVSCDRLRSFVDDVVACSVHYGLDDVHSEAAEMLRSINQ